MSFATLTEALKEDLHRRRMTQKAFAAQMGLSVTAINKWTEIPDKWMSRALDVLGLDSEAVQFSVKAKVGRMGKLLVIEPRLQSMAEATRPPAPEAPPKQVFRLNLSKGEHPSQAMRRRFYEALPDHLRQHAEKRLTFGHRMRRLDYLSSRIGLTLVTAPPSTSGVTNLNMVVPTATMQLMLARALTKPQEDFLWMVAVVLPPGQQGAPAHPLQSFATLHADLGLLGIDLMFAETPEVVARYVADLETAAQDPVPPDQFDEDDPHWQA